MHVGSAEMHNRKAGVAALSIVSNAVLVGLKLVIGLLIGSVSVLSEAIHSAVDLVASVVAYLSVRTSAKPADARHPFGHGKYENLSGVIEALLIFVAAVWIVVEAIHKLLAPAPLEMAGIGVGVMLVSSAANWLISARLFRIGRETESIALQADAWHLRTDVYTSIGVMTGLSIIWIGYWVAPGLDLGWVDPVAALCVAALIMKAAWDLTAESVKDLLDARLPDTEEAWIKAHIRDMHPLVRGIHDLRTRKGGAIRFVEFHLMVPEDLTVVEAHGISDRVEEAIMARYPSTHVTTHIEPCRRPCTETCLRACFHGGG